MLNALDKKILENMDEVSKLLEQGMEKFDDNSSDTVIRNLKKRKMVETDGKNHLSMTNKFREMVADYDFLKEALENHHIASKMGEETRKCMTIAITYDFMQKNKKKILGKKDDPAVTLLILAPIIDGILMHLVEGLVSAGVLENDTSDIDRSYV
jgi:hypothetical protein